MASTDRKTILLTGVAGFIGAKTAEVLLSQGYKIIGIDNLSDYYDVRLKLYRLSLLEKHKNFIFYKSDIERTLQLQKIFKKHRIGSVLHFAARPGVRDSQKNPRIYLSTNIIGTYNLLELCKSHHIGQFIMASSSSVYNGHIPPFKESMPIFNPSSVYAASKISAEHLAYTYHYLYGIHTVLLRFFTIYGPAGRPDMAPLKFTALIARQKPLLLYGNGRQSRDFTYIDDAVDAVVRSLKLKGCHILNIGRTEPRELLELIKYIERFLKIKSRVIYRAVDKTDMASTHADIGKAKKLLSWVPKVGLQEGTGRLVEWYVQNKHLVDHLQL